MLQHHVVNHWLIFWQSSKERSSIQPWSPERPSLRSFSCLPYQHAHEIFLWLFLWLSGYVFWQWVIVDRFLCSHHTWGCYSSRKWSHHCTVTHQSWYQPAVLQPTWSTLDTGAPSGGDWWVNMGQCSVQADKATAWWRTNILHDKIWQQIPRNCFTMTLHGQLKTLGTPSGGD